MSNTTCVHVIISGRVQGVYYRAWTGSTARERGLTGWVRNRSDGTVEAVFCGDATEVEKMLEECKSGPPAARVVDIQRKDWTGEVPVDFQKRDTV